MKKNIVAVAVVAAAGFTSMTSIAQAADGTIIFTGGVSGQTCNINANKGGPLTVALPFVSASALSAAGQVAGRTGFALNLSDCAMDTGRVSTYFEPGPTVDPATGGLILAPGGAANLQLGLLNADFSRIQAGAPEGSQNSQIVDISDGAATLDYYVQYEAVGGPVGYGAANSSVMYTMMYP